MNALDLIGAVGASVLRSRLSTPVADNGVARFMLNRLRGEQVAAIVKALLKDTALAAKTKFAIPRSLVANEGLPESVLTDERPVAIRNAPIEGFQARDSKGISSRPASRSPTARFASCPRSESTNAIPPSC